MEFDATEIANLIKTKQLSPKEAVMNAFSEIKTKKRPTERGRQPA